MHFTAGGIVASVALLTCSCVGALESGPFGFGAQATGGGSATPQTPKDISELASWLADSVPRVILLDKTYDFTDTEGNKTSAGWSVFLRALGSEILCTLS